MITTGPDLQAIRQHCLDAAIGLHSARYDNADDTGVVDRELRATAQALFGFATGPAHLFVTLGPVLDQKTGQETGTTLRGTPMQLHDTEQVDLTVTVADVKGVVIGDDPGTTADDLTWSTDDDTVASLTISPDTRVCTVIAGLPGSTIVTVALGELSATLAVDVIAGAAAKIQITEGEPTEQPVPEPEPEV